MSSTAPARFFDIAKHYGVDGRKVNDAGLRKNIPVLSDLADREHPSPVYHDITKGIFSRINQLAPCGEAVSRQLQPTGTFQTKLHYGMAYTKP